MRIEGREVADVRADIENREALPLEEQTERLKNRLGQVVLEAGFQTLALSLRRPCCCGRPMENKRRRDITVPSVCGPTPIALRHFVTVCPVTPHQWQMAVSGNVSTRSCHTSQASTRAFGTSLPADSTR